MTDPNVPDVPHLAWPLRLTADGTLAQVEQDTAEDVRQCVAVLVRTQPGSRPLAPELGFEDPTFTPGVSVPLIERAIEEQEPRAAVTVTVTPLSGGEQRVQVVVGLADESTGEGGP